MDETAVILAALTTGLQDGVIEAGKTLVSDAYTALKKKLISWFRAKESQKGEMALEEFEKNRDAWQEALKSVLKETGADKNNDIMTLANEVLRMSIPNQSGELNVQIQAKKIDSVTNIHKVDSFTQTFGAKENKE